MQATKKAARLGRLTFLVASLRRHYPDQVHRSFPQQTAREPLSPVCPSSRSLT